MEKVIEINREKKYNLKYNVKDCIILLKKFEFFAPTCCVLFTFFFIECRLVNKINICSQYVLLI